MAISGRPRKCDPKVDNLRQNITYNEIDVAKTTLNEFGIDATDSEARTALILCAIENKIDFAKWLILHGANVDLQDREGYSALHYCAQNHYLEFAELLLQNNANPNVVDAHGNAPLWTAVFNSKDTMSIVQLLLKHKADPDLLNQHGRSPRIMYQTFYNSDINEVLNND